MAFAVRKIQHALAKRNISFACGTWLDCLAERTETEKQEGGERASTREKERKHWR